MIHDSYLESKNTIDFSNTMYHFTIVLMTKRFGGEKIKVLRWEGYNVDWLTKWRWYFDYRAALLKVQNPRCDVECKWGPFKTEMIQDENVIQYRRWKKDLVTAKRMYTKYENALEEFKRIQSTLLLPNWNDPKYIKGLEKLKFYKNKIEEFNQLINNENRNM